MKPPVTRQQIVDTARTWIGTPFKHQGRTKGVGVDCIGLIVGVSHELGLFDHDYRRYAIDPNPSTMYRLLLENFRMLPVRKAEPGDFFYMRFSREPQHVAFYAGDGFIIHSYNYVNAVCVECSYNKMWQRRTVAAFSLKGAPCLLRSVA